MNDTIVFIHRGHSWYLYYTVKQARAWHPKADVVVISDVAQPEVAPYAKVLPISRYWGSAAELTKIYEHFSTNPYEFELFCFQRWFVMNEFIAIHQPSRIIHLDSDLLVFDDLTKDFDRLNGADVGLVGFQGPFSMLIPRPQFVGQFCKRINALYTEEKKELAEMFKEWRRDGAETAVSDMHALHTLISKSNLQSCDLGIPYQGTAYDSIIQDSEGYESENGCKRLKWENNQPYALATNTQQWIRFKTIHCQGPSKAKILEFFTARDLGYWRDRLLKEARNRFRNMIQRGKLAKSG